MPTGWILRAVCLAMVCLACEWEARTVFRPPAAQAAEAPRPVREQERIAALLEAVDHSQATFIREEKAYSAADGRRHLERKLRYAGDRVVTAEDFIERIASRSSTTGRPYGVRLPTGEEMEAGVWFRQKLAEIDGRR